MSKKGRKEIAKLWEEKYCFKMPSEYEVAMMTEEQYANYMQCLKGILPKHKAEEMPEMVVFERKKPEVDYQETLERANEERKTRMLEANPDYSPDDEDLSDLYQISEIMGIKIL